MQQYKYKNIDEVMYYEKLDNGLEVYLVPKTGFHKTYAIFATHFGALSNRFVPYGQDEYMTVPLGIAHFLEHKLFEMPDGDDASNMFSELGADANAFTDYSETAYLATCTSNTKEVLELLLDYVQEPVFNDENVSREQGIIIQELKMYLDKPGSRIHLGLLQNMYKENLIREDIVGTEESIRAITKEHLYTCYETFYHPSNMVYVVVGNIEPNETMKWIRDNQQKKTFKSSKDIKREFVVEDNTVATKSSEITMDILIPKVSVGLKLPYRKYEKNELMLLDYKFKMLLESTFGVSSDNYQELLDKELINTGFHYAVSLDEYTGFLKINANTYKVEEFIAYVKEKLLLLQEFTMSDEDFERMKKAMIGSMVTGFNHMEFIGDSIIDYKFKNCDLFECVDLLQQIKKEELYELREYFVEKAICDFRILPKQKR